MTKTLSSVQKRLINAWVNRGTEWTDFDDLAALVGIKRDTVEAWICDVDFLEAVKQYVDAKYLADGAKVRAGVVSAAAGGNASMAKLYFQHLEETFKARAESLGGRMDRVTDKFFERMLLVRENHLIFNEQVTEKNDGKTA